MKLFKVNIKKLFLISTVSVVILAVLIIYPIFQLRRLNAGELEVLKYEEILENPEHIHAEDETEHPHAEDEAEHPHAEDEAEHPHAEDETGHDNEEQGSGAEQEDEEHGQPYFDEYGLIYSEPGYKEYNVKLSSFKFFPEVIRVKEGDRVKLNLDSVDVVHGLQIDGYDINVKVPEEKIVSIEFVANKAGSIRTRCSIPCGSFHPFMVGNIMVLHYSYSSVNPDFLWAIFLAFIIPFSVLGLLIIKNDNRKDKNINDK